MRRDLPLAAEYRRFQNLTERCFALLCLLLLMAGCVTTKPVKKDVEDIPIETRQHLASYNYNLAQKFWERDRADLAMRYLKMAVKQDPAATAPRLKILDLLLLCNDANGALEYLEECPETVHEQAAFLKRRALALDLKAKAGEAETVLGRLVAGSECDATVLTAAAENLILQGKTGEAFTLLTTAHKHHPMETSFLTSLSDLCRALGRYDEEVEFRMSLAMLRPDRPAYVREAAMAFIHAERIDEGLERIAWLDKGTEEQPEPLVSAVLGRLRFHKGDLDLAALYLKAAFESKQFVPDRGDFLALAEIHLRNKAYPDALGVLKEALKKDPEHELTRAALAWAYYCAGSRDQSRRVIMQAPRPLEVNGHLGAMKKRLASEEEHDESL